MSIETDRLLGTDLAAYRIESVLGRGGMGVVYLAQDLRLNGGALKLVAPELAADPRFRERFLREAELAASLDHSHIEPVDAAGSTLPPATSPQLMSGEPLARSPSPVTPSG